MLFVCVSALMCVRVRVRVRVCVCVSVSACQCVCVCVRVHVSRQECLSGWTLESSGVAVECVIARGYECSKVHRTSASDGPQGAS